MTSNKITLELTNGKRFILYVNEPTRLCMNEFPNPPTGFSLDVTHDFHDELKTIIESETKTTVYFYLPREYKGYLVIKRRKAK
ncbi:hypothetical protein KAW08_04470 [bacterium]|nr:hypothetical protein [bacterium]